MKFTYHHIGIPTTESHPDEEYYPEYKSYTWGFEGSEFRVQWHRYEKGCPLHPLIQKVPHVAFKVHDLEEAIRGKKVIEGPFEPIPGWRVAFIEDGGAPIEFIESDFTDEEVMDQARKTIRKK